MDQASPGTNANWRNLDPRFVLLGWFINDSFFHFVFISFYMCVHFAVKDDGCFQGLDWLIDLDMPSFDMPSRRSVWCNDVWDYVNQISDDKFF